MLALAIFATLFLRLWSLQVLNGEQLLRASQNNQRRDIRVQAPRGPDPGSERTGAREQHACARRSDLVV